MDALSGTSTDWPLTDNGIETGLTMAKVSDNPNPRLRDLCHSLSFEARHYTKENRIFPFQEQQLVKHSGDDSFIGECDGTSDVASRWASIWLLVPREAGCFASQ
jgi:hypothetical protein